jgi:2-haloacid dehalogenase
MKAAWIKRSQENVFDPWEVEPTITITNLSEILDRLVDL